MTTKSLSGTSTHSPSTLKDCSSPSSILDLKPDSEPVPEQMQQPTSLRAHQIMVLKPRTPPGDHPIHSVTAGFPEFTASLVSLLVDSQGVPVSLGLTPNGLSVNLSEHLTALCPYPDQVLSMRVLFPASTHFNEIFTRCFKMDYPNNEYSIAHRSSTIAFQSLQYSSGPEAEQGALWREGLPDTFEFGRGYQLRITRADPSFFESRTPD